MINKNYKYDISIIVCTYNAEWNKLKKTILSIILQRKSDIEIIIADDGSIENYMQQIILLFKKCEFYEYKFSINEKNYGTCKNVKMALEIVEGKYTKLISPGDYLYDDAVLQKWFEYMEDKQIEISFGLAVYYKRKFDKCIPIREIAYPQNTKIYDLSKYSQKTRLLNYIFLGDSPNGAMFMVKTDLYLKYMNILSESIKYAEDCVYRIMLLCGEQITFFDDIVIWYEFGTGISTVKVKKWNDILNAELVEALKIGAEKIENNGLYSRKLKFLCRIYSHNRIYTILKYLLFPQLIYWKILKNKCLLYTPTNVGNCFVDS